MSPAACKVDYTIKTANETLPLVKMIVSDIVEIAGDVSETRQRLSYLSVGRQESPVDEYSQELSSIQQLTDEKSDRLNGFIDELLDLNIDPSQAEQGYIDFPARREEKEVCLCWRLGEPQVMYWHHSDEDCSRRRLVDLPLVQLSVRQQFSNPA